MKIVITIIGYDCVGIVAMVSSTLAPTVTGFALGGSTTPASTAPAPTWLCLPTVSTRVG